MNDNPPKDLQIELAEALMLLDRVTACRDNAEKRVMELAQKCDKLEAEIARLKKILYTPFQP